MSKNRSVGLARSDSSRCLSDAQRRRFLRLENLEPRLFLATMPDFVTLSSQSALYRDGYFLEIKQPKLATIVDGQVHQFDFRTNSAGDQTAQIQLPSNLDKLRLIVDPNQGYGLWFVHQGEGSLGVRAFDSDGNLLGLLNVPYFAGHPRTQDSSFVEVYSILGDAGTALPTGTAWIQFEHAAFEHARFGFLNDQSQ